MNTNNFYKYIYTAFVFLLLFSSCELDERIDDLSGGYQGKLIDKNTNALVATEYYGSKIKLLDLNYGEIAVPLELEIKPDGSFNNTKVFPSKYKIWATGPFFELDTVYTELSNGNKNVELLVNPNVSLSIDEVRVKYGIAAEVTFSYQVNDLSSISQKIGIVYGEKTYPGFRTAVLETSKSTTYKRIKTNVNELTGVFTETFYLKPNTTYYFRALGRTENAGDYWNYSKQEMIETTDLDISAMPIDFKQSITSASSAILQWAFPPIVDEIKVAYTDRDGLSVEQRFLPDELAYVANLAENSLSPISVQLFSNGVAGTVQELQIQTKKLEDRYVSAGRFRPEHVPFYYDEDFKKSLSGQWATILGPSVDPGWVTSPFRFSFFDWWNTWLLNNGNMPSCQNIEDFTSLTLEGNIKTLIDILGFRNLEELKFLQGEHFSVGEAVNVTIDLSVLKSLKKLKKVILGNGVNLDESHFRAAGLSNLEIIKE